MICSTAVLLAAGQGSRMGTEIRKQYLELGGEPLLARPLRTFLKSSVITDIVLVIPKGDEKFIRETIIPAALNNTSGAPDMPGAEGKIRAIIPGGKERYDSVWRGLQAIDWPCDYVFIHDGARPFIQEDALARLLEAVKEQGTAVAAMPSKDTVKIADKDGFVTDTPDRSSVWIVQTPQVFDKMLITGAYEEMMQKLPELNARGIRITDDAMAVELMTGRKVKLVPASYSNIKVTTPDDIAAAGALLEYL